MAVDRLQVMLDTQQKLQFEFDARARSSDPQQRCEYVKDMCIATVAEMMELMEETGWKPWSTSWHVNVQEARAEWIDAWHFMMNIANVLGLTAADIDRSYHVKAEVNLARIRGGYDGVSTKCPGCRRALDDPATRCYPLDVEVLSPSSPIAVWCMELGRQVSMKQH